MPVAEENTQPKGRAYGARAAEQRFTQSTQPPQDLEPEGQPGSYEIPDFGDGMEVLLSPSERPEEHVLTQPGLGRSRAVPPPREMVLLAQDPDLGEEFRAIMALGVISRATGAGLPID